MSADRHILHLDMDAFYASVEILDAPALAGKPVIVGGGERGVVAAASYEARKYGIHSAMPIVTARRLCPTAIFCPPRMARYREVSARIMAIFQEVTPLVEPLSLDEAFLDVTASLALFGPADQIAARLKERIRHTLGLTVSAGVAGCKLVAKVASDLEKPDGLTIVPPGQERAFLAPLPIAKLWGVGPTTRAQLALLGVVTIGDLCRLPLELLVQKFGLQGRHLYLAARAEDQRPVEPVREIQSIGHEETFNRDLLARAALRRILLALAAKVGRRTRGYGLSGKTVTLKVKYYDFSQITKSATLAQPTSDDRTIYRQACRLLEKTKAGGTPIRLVGISLSKLSALDSPWQPSLFAEPDGEARRRPLTQAMDAINDKFGPRFLQPARLLADEPLGG